MMFKVGDKVIAWEENMGIPEQLVLIEKVQTVPPKGYWVTATDKDGDSSTIFVYTEEVRAFTKLDKELS